MAPTNEQMSVFATCCAMYEASSTSSYTHEVPDASSFGMKLLEVYDQHIKGSESWPSKLTRTFSQVDMKNTTYFGTIPRPQARIVSDFQQLLTYRNDQLTKCVSVDFLFHANF
jgi:hypothetical protein